MQNIISNFENLSESDISEYAGKWIAVIDNKIIVSAKTFKEVYEFAKRSYPKERALIGKLPEAVSLALSLS